MRKPKNKCEIRLSSDDIAEAVELYLNKNQNIENLNVISVKGSRSKNYIIIAEFE